MSRIGQKKTVLLSLLVTFASLLLPVFGDSYMLMLISFSLWASETRWCRLPWIRCFLTSYVATVWQAAWLSGSLWKPLPLSLLLILPCGERHKPFRLSFRLAHPVPDLHDWAVIAILLLNVTQIKEEKEEGKPSTFGQCLALLGKPFILLSFIGIMCHVGIDVGTNTTAPKILMERLGMGLDDAAFATSLYFIFRRQAASSVLSFYVRCHRSLSSALVLWWCW